MKIIVIKGRDMEYQDQFTYYGINNTGQLYRTQIEPLYSMVIL